ncbi:MAG: hypothetical protein M1438_20690 [Deltaproteobacteria bacterium]|nr:hypothetical protein [Deltaproteobacteria bacterium]
MLGYFIAIPTYWSRPGSAGPEEVVYDHPTPLDSPGTLRRTLESLAPLVSAGVQVGVVAAAASKDLGKAVESRVRELIHTPPLPFPVAFFSTSHLRALQEFVGQHGQPEWTPLLSLCGYAQIRNLTLILANICAAEVLVSLDDDEIIIDPEFLARIERDFALLSRGYDSFGLAGIYRDAQGGVRLPEPQAPWAGYWPKIRWLNEAFTQLLAAPRLPATPLALGGNLALSSGVYRRVPFDPAIPRGEDVDYVFNARLLNIPFFLDQELSITHLPPEKPHPLWLKLRQDLLRFAYARQKLRQQEPRPGLARVTAEDLRPYPGHFLGDDLEMRAYQSHTQLAMDYLGEGDSQGARQTLENLILLEQIIHSGKNVFREYLHTVAQWQALQNWLAEPTVAAQAKEAIWG